MNVRSFLAPVIVAFALLGILFVGVAAVRAQTDSVTIYLFHSETCPHCKKERIFLEDLDKRYDTIQVETFEITGNRENIELFQQVGKELSADISGVPFTVVGREYISGYADDATTGKQIEMAALSALHGYEGTEYVDIVQPFLQGLESEDNFNIKGEVSSDPQVPEYISVPFVGQIETQSVSLPFLTFVVALLDGFNPCAMWVLVFLISMLLGMKSKTRMWVLGSVFILTSAVIYFLFMSAWLNLFLFLGYIIWIRIIVGVFAFGVGAYYLYDYITNPNATCKVTGDPKRKKILERIRETVHEKNFFIALGGIILLAIAVNMIEAVCSAGLPAIYTKVLVMSDLPTWQYYAYLLFYILIFMLDDLIVFVGAMLTFRSFGLDSKYARYSHLIGGIIMLLLGLLLMFRPEWLMFG